MNELKGQFVNIVLSIEEGRGFDSVKLPLYITANFNGRVMQSDLMDPHPNIIFNTEMVWETEKKLLRKARGAYGRIRLECYTSERKFIGFALLCLRSAKVLPSSRTDIEVTYAWNKLLNVPNEFKKGTPELNVSLTIKDLMATTKTIPPAIPNFSPGEIENHLKIPIKYALNGFIQVGDERENLEKFHLKVVAKMATNLDALLPESLVFAPMPKNNFLSFNILGMDVNTRTIRDLHDNVNVNETVVINLLSNLNILGLYFQTFPKITITFYSGDIKLGTTNVAMDFINFDNIEEEFVQNQKAECEQQCYFVNDASNFTDATRRPCLIVGCIIEIGSNKEEGQGDKDITSPPRLLLHSSSKIEKKTQQADRKLLLQQRNVDESGVKLMQNTTTTMPDDGTKEVETLRHYKQFGLDIILDSIVWKRQPKTNSYILNFIHPKANTYLHIKTEIDKQVNKKLLFENAVCKMMFVCGTDRITHLLNYYRPRLQFFDQKSNPIAEDIILDSSKINLTKPEVSFIVQLKSIRGEEIADVNVCMFLEACSFTKKNNCGFDLLPHILDDCILFQDLDELENWKENERSKFGDELKRLKDDQLAKLHEQWVMRKTKLENDLNNNIDRCKRLSRELRKKAQDSILENKLHERIESDNEFNLFLEIHKNTVKYALSESHELIEKICNLEHECATLRDLLNEQSLEMIEMKQTTLTNEQTKNLLHDLKTIEEKYEEAQRDKNYFKQEWERTMKEMHSLKMEDQMNLQHKIATNKEALSQLSLDSYTTALIEMR